MCVLQKNEISTRNKSIARRIFCLSHTHTQMKQGAFTRFIYEYKYVYNTQTDTRTLTLAQPQAENHKREIAHTTHYISKQWRKNKSATMIKQRYTHTYAVLYTVTRSFTHTVWRPKLCVRLLLFFFLLVFFSTYFSLFFGFFWSHAHSLCIRVLSVVYDDGSIELMMNSDARKTNVTNDSFVVNARVSLFLNGVGLAMSMSIYRILIWFDLICGLFFHNKHFDGSIRGGWDWSAMGQSAGRRTIYVYGPMFFSFFLLLHVTRKYWLSK